MPKQRRLPEVAFLLSNPRKHARLWMAFTAIVMVALLQADSGSPGHRALAVLTSLLSGVMGGVLFGRRSGIWLGLLLGLFHNGVRELFGAAQETLLTVLPVYIIVVGGASWLSATGLDLLRDSKDSLSHFERELAASERTRVVLQLVSRVGAQLSSHEVTSEPVTKALTELCTTLDLDVIIIRRNEASEAGLCSRIESWITRSGADDDLARNDGKLDWHALPNMRDRLASGEAYAFSSLDELPLPDRVTLATGIARLEAVLNLPVVEESQWLGHTAFGTRRAGRQWSAEDVASLSILADMISSAWQRERQTRQLVSVIDTRERAIRAQRALTEGTNLLLTQDTEEPLKKTLNLVMDALEGDVAYIEMFEEDCDLGLVSRPIEHLYRDPSIGAASVTWPLSSSPVAANRYLAGLPSIFGSHEEESSSDPERLEPYTENALAAECNFPIVSKDETLGFVGVGTFAPRQWTPVDTSVMQSFAHIVSAYLEREQAMRQLEDLVTAKDRFIGSVSHELRTPLAVVVGLAAELEDNDDAFTSEERGEFLGMIRRQSAEVSDIIDDLLVSTRISETELTVIEETFLLDDLVRQVLNDLPSDIASKIERTNLTPTLVTADPLRTRQIVRNLVTNAHRYGGPHVTITVSSSDGRSLLAVVDDGLGVPEERRDQIFEAYHTSGGERTVTAAIGLGLTVSRQLARLMGGDVIYVHGEHPRFELQLESAVPTRAVSSN